MTAEAVQIRRVTDPNDPAIRAFGTLQDRIYFEPEMLIPARYIAQLLQDEGAARQNVLLLAEEDGRLLGGTLFHFLAEASTGFSSFLGVDPSARGRGVARRLHTARWQALQEVSGEQCQALFIDVVNPARESAAQREQERRAGSDAAGRRQTFHTLGFRTVDLAYEQPVGGENPELPGGGPVTDMDLLAYVPTRRGAEELPETISAGLVGATMRAYWTPWLGREQAERAALKLQAGQAEVRLLPAWEGPAARS
ncbi:GNAT family N-acetyltransferase [Deinococcus radiomollis]|uniref:GNAT family N-acetyltransferase n=1 Tax=Deinococcus radiomollis TaxID=468916 RepID=UPI003891BDBA